MTYTYRYSYLDSEGRLRTDSEKIGAENWLAYLQANDERYGNLGEYITASFPALKAENPLVAAAIAGQLDETFRDNEPTVVFQFLMYCWSAFKTGEIPAGAWAAALAGSWQCGQRALLDHVALAESLVIRMFRAADPEALFRVGASRKNWDEYYAALPERIDIYRGISSGSKFKENGLCWTTDPEEAKRFAARNVTTATQIPGVIHARVPKPALLAVFDIAQAVVIDPTVAKEDLSTNFLSGPGLNKFRQNWKKLRAEEAEKLRAVANKR